ncbi:EGF-like domain protein [Ostertagia ostertagi]
MSQQEALNATAEIVLLTVFDSSTGKKLAECSDVTGAEAHWSSFQWTLKSDVLLCTVSPKNFSRTVFPPSTNPRTFFARIEAVRGSVCIGEVEVQNMRFYGCPRHLELNSLSSLNLDCSCPYEHDDHETVISFPTDPPFPIFELEGTPQSPRQAVWTVGPCANFACLNNGTCVVAQEGSAACLCPDGFIGGTCEIDVCSTVPCQNGGHCRADGGEGRCVCPPEFTGILCESVIEGCNPPCVNGHCFVVNNTKRCKCKQGFIGTTCSMVDVCYRDAVCALYGEEAKCTVNETSYNLTNAPSFNAYYECRCPHPLNGEYVDCLALHLSTSVSVATSPYRLVSNGLTTSSLSTNIVDTITEEEEIPPAATVLVTTSSPFSPRYSSPALRLLSSPAAPETSTFFTPASTLSAFSTEPTSTQAHFAPHTEIEPSDTSTPTIQTTSTYVDDPFPSTSFNTTTYVIPVEERTTTDFPSTEVTTSNKVVVKMSKTTVADFSEHHSSAASWLVAIVAMIVLGLLLLATTLFVLRYIRQSRKLHGKYNPAREEHALSAAFSMPMSRIPKEERLI